MRTDPESWSTDEWEVEIRRILGRHTVSECLRSLHVHGRELPQFQQAGFGMWAVKAGQQDVGVPQTGPYLKGVFDQEAVAVMKYLINDPAGEGMPSTLLEVMLRLPSSQFTFANGGADFARAYLLWCELPGELAQNPRTRFDFLPSFTLLHGVDPLTFLKTCFVLYCAAIANNKFTGGYMIKAAQQGMAVSDEAEVRKVLDAVSGTPDELRSLAVTYQLPDRRFAPYDFNPLLMRPIVRPWGRVDDLDKEGLIAPVPSLIQYRVSAGVYYGLFNQFKTKFSRYFGDLFEAYVGRVLAEFDNGETVIPEDALRGSTPKDGKVVDWVVRIGNVAIVLECKATKFNRTAQQTGASDAINDSLKQVRSGIDQCVKFIADCKSGARKAPELDGCTTFIPVVLTWEAMPTINSKPMTEGFLPEARTSGCIVLSVEDLERLQMRSKKGLDLAATLLAIQEHGEHHVLGELDERLPAVHGDSFLIRYDDLLFKAIAPIDM